MKPIITWVVLANTRHALVLANRGPGKGLGPDAEKKWTSPEPAEYRDKAGVGHSIAGPGVSAVDDGNIQLAADKAFARQIMSDLHAAHQNRSFDRLVIVAGPHMLGLLRDCLDNHLRQAVTAEVAKDLTTLPPREVAEHLGDVLAT